MNNFKELPDCELLIVFNKLSVTRLINIAEGNRDEIAMSNLAEVYEIIKQRIDSNIWRPRKKRKAYSVK